MAYDYREFDNRLTNAGVSRSCPSCGSTERSAVSRPIALVEVNEDGYLQMLQATEDLRAVTATFCGAHICDTCGFVRMHALGALDIKFP